jgi:hypothetical protein
MIFIVSQVMIVFAIYLFFHARTKKSELVGVKGQITFCGLDSTQKNGKYRKYYTYKTIFGVSGSKEIFEYHSGDPKFWKIYRKISQKGSVELYYDVEKENIWEINLNNEKILSYEEYRFHEVKYSVIFIVLGLIGFLSTVFEVRRDLK